MAWRALRDLRRVSSSQMCRAGAERALQYGGGACAQIHGNVCMAAVVVTDQLDWRLHGFDLLSEHEGVGDLPLMAASWMVSAPPTTSDRGHSCDSHTLNYFDMMAR